jgi:hypothetical protein
MMACTQEIGMLLYHLSRSLRQARKLKLGTVSALLIDAIAHVREEMRR